MASNIDDTLRRLRRLLALAKSENPNEAALAAERAAEMMVAHRISEATLAVAGEARPIEEILEGHVVTETRRRCAWKSTIASAVVQSYGGRMYWHGGGIRFFGRDSAVQAATYTSQYLWREVERLCDAGWANRNSGDTYGQSSKGWRNAFRVGAASVIALRLRQRTHAITAERVAAVAAVRHDTLSDTLSVTTSTQRTDVLAVIEREDHEVDTRYTAAAKRWRAATPIGRVSSLGGYANGREAGQGVHLGGGGRAGIGAGAARLFEGGK